MFDAIMPQAGRQGESSVDVRGGQLAQRLDFGRRVLGPLGRRIGVCQQSCGLLNRAGYGSQIGYGRFECLFDCFVGCDLWGLGKKTNAGAGAAWADGGDRSGVDRHKTGGEP